MEEETKPLNYETKPTVEFRWGVVLGLIGLGWLVAGVASTVIAHWYQRFRYGYEVDPIHFEAAMIWLGIFLPGGLGSTFIITWRENRRLERGQ